jgi:hypothetical protein
MTLIICDRGKLGADFLEIQNLVEYLFYLFFISLDENIFQFRIISPFLLPKCFNIFRKPI